MKSRKSCSSNEVFQKRVWTSAVELWMQSVTASSGMAAAEARPQQRAPELRKTPKVERVDDEQWSKKRATAIRDEEVITTVDGGNQQ
ncbi:OLC1v1036017C1 [Oldenlandia corymbosa var. corymbosa]|uniref:OLC1v1036017C1 n=1 Tax=Oldenlandia corymbosa var. corymbosa TaxID=529605 RepID=A0AAV1CUS3_OLDCO|nr:OLC1v1036017C1 [Oldenlandia corymbosa var. corymbosa]